MRHRSEGGNCGAPRTYGRCHFSIHASCPPILRCRCSVARGSTSPGPNSARLSRTWQQRESAYPRNSYIRGAWSLPPPYQAPRGRPSSPKGRPRPFFSTLDLELETCRLRERSAHDATHSFDPTALQFAGRSDLVTGMGPLSTDATSSIFSESGMNMRDLFAEDVRASFRPPPAPSSSVQKTSVFSQRGAIGIAEEQWLRFQAIRHNNAQVGAMEDTTFLCVCRYCQGIGVG